MMHRRKMDNCFTALQRSAAVDGGGGRHALTPEAYSSLHPTYTSSERFATRTSSELIGLGNDALGIGASRHLFSFIQGHSHRTTHNNRPATDMQETTRQSRCSQPRATIRTDRLSRRGGMSAMPRQFRTHSCPGRGQTCGNRQRARRTRNLTAPRIRPSAHGQTTSRCRGRRNYLVERATCDYLVERATCDANLLLVLRTGDGIGHWHCAHWGAFMQPHGTGPQRRT